MNVPSSAVLDRIVVSGKYTSLWYTTKKCKYILHATGVGITFSSCFQLYVSVPLNISALTFHC